jgi:hypothetical protein
MNTTRKFWLVLVGVILAMAVIACSCGSIIPTPSPSPYPTLAPLPTLQPLPLATQETSTVSMAGRWLDPDTSGTVTTIVAQGNGFAVESVINPERGGNELTETNWSNNELTWTYCVPSGNCITSVTGWVSSDSLYTTYTDDQGNSGETTFQRLP